LSGSASNYLALLWQSSGTGTFSNSTTLNTTYYPTYDDFISGFINFYLTATPVSPCTNQVSDGRHDIIVICDGINDNNALKISILPNPSDGRFVLKTKSETNSESVITIYDLTGKLIFNETIAKGFTSKQLDISLYPKGIYLLKYWVDGVFIAKKLVIQ
jgi:hypothetical protein